METHVERISNLQDIKKATLDRETGLFLYEDMTLGRRFEDKCAEMYYRGKMFGFVHLYNGQEAISTGVIGAMKKKHDWFCSTYRDHVHALSAGVPSFEVMSELFGKATGCSKGRGGSMHLFSREHHLLGGYAFIGEGIPVALGAAFSSKYKKEVSNNNSSDSVTAAFFGDGTCNNCQVSKSKSLKNSLLAFINSPFISVSVTSANTFNGLKIKDSSKNKGNIPLKKIFLFDFVIFFIFRIHQGIQSYSCSYNSLISFDYFTIFFYNSR